MELKRLHMQRRAFFTLAMGVPTALRGAREIEFDVAVIGGGVGGCAAALAASRTGARVILTEETDWIGGQLTSQGVPPDEHPWIESFGCTRSYREYRNRVREYYRRHYPLTAAAREKPNLNPGNGSVSRLTHEPRVSLAVLEGMLAPYVSSGRLTVLLRHQPTAADVDGNRVKGITVRDLDGGGQRIVRAKYFLDATEMGDLLPLTGAEYVTGFEGHTQTGELHAPAKAQPLNMQSATACFAMDYVAGEDHTIDRPEDYAFWRDYIPRMTPAYPGKLLSMDMPEPSTLRKRALDFEPGVEVCRNGKRSFWTYRRILDRNNFSVGAYSSDISAVNWPQNDFWLGNLFEVGKVDAARNLRSAKQLSLSFFYWLQTEHERPDGGRGWAGLRLRRDVMGTADGLAKSPYIRESRRIRAEFTVLEQHVGTEARMAATGKSREDVKATVFDDSVGVGSYRIDLHPSTGGDNYIDISSLPFQIPLGALIPARMDNLIPACKNLGVTHITNGCYRLHPVEWNIGESAGALAAFSIQMGEKPRAVRNDRKLLSELQRRLVAEGVELSWPSVTPR